MRYNNTVFFVIETIELCGARTVVDNSREMKWVLLDVDNTGGGVMIGSEESDDTTNKDKEYEKKPLPKFKWKVYEPGESLKKLDALLSIGGDGTLLESITHIGKDETPVLGINTGRLGFLATISKDDVEEAITKIFSGAFTLDKRAVLRLESNKELFS